MNLALSELLPQHFPLEKKKKQQQHTLSQQMRRQLSQEALPGRHGWHRGTCSHLSTQKLFFQLIIDWNCGCVVAVHRWHHISSSWLPRFHGVSGETGCKSRFDWPLGLLPSVLLISSLIASLRFVVKFAGQQIDTDTHTQSVCVRVCCSQQVDSVFSLWVSSLPSPCLPHLGM